MDGYRSLPFLVRGTMHDVRFSAAMQHMGDGCIVPDSTWLMTDGCIILKRIKMINQAQVENRGNQAPKEIRGEDKAKKRSKIINQVTQIFR